ncbi:MAG TPA: MFS transporter [Streptosporangiaceae bacterium]|nr:MFS transporter [Streptosporangiaceae bacterium]
MTTVATKRQQPIRSTIPARLDRLRWSPFHTRLVLGLGTAWILDGLEITIASSVGSLFDTLGRRKMISGTYLISGSVLAFSAWLFDAGVLHAAGQTFIWIVVFFFASAGASAGYLTVSEIFPVEIRAEAIAVFFAIAQIFGALGTIFCGAPIGTGSNRAGLTIGYLIGGGVMIIGGLVEVFLGINAEGKPLEQVARSLTEVRAERS